MGELYMKERRESDRVPLAALLEIFSKDSEVNVCRGFVKNLGEDGLAFETSKRLRLNGEFKLRFTLPDGWNFEIIGEIKYIKEGILTIAHGARFTKIEEKDKKAIKEYIESRRKKNADY
jgi:hypothetical protein